MHFGAANHDAIGSTLNNSKIGVGVWLGRGTETAISLDVGLRNRHRKVVVSAVFKECGDSLGSLCVAARGIECSSNTPKGEEGVGTDLFDERDQRVASRGSSFDEACSIGKICC
jgi:hypothetical protein